MRTEVAIISALALVLSVPLAFGEIVETKGQNYDLVENFFIGEANWVSHPERIMDGGWQNYALSNTGDKVIFNTNAVGSFIFDKNSCSYSIYGNGFDGEQIIPSVSAVATYLNNGQWQNLPVNDEACTVTVSEYEDGVFLTSTKVITEDITEDIFIDYTGTTENFYGNATNTNFNLIQSSNGTNTGYFNGETRVLESVEVGKFVQELRLDINSGFKETFKVTYDGSEELGISQTIHSGESITIGDQTINIAELNGQSFDRQFIIDNQAEILAITDSVNYDFDTGIESLSNVNIIFDGDYKVNMDYADGGFIGYLEIDPTFGYSQGDNVATLITNYSTGTSCGTTVSNKNTASLTLSLPTSSANDVCQWATVQWDLSSIPIGSAVTDSSFKYDPTTELAGGAPSTIRPMVYDITTATDQQLLDDILDGTPYVTGSSITEGVDQETVDLGASADTDITTAISDDGIFGIGIHYDNLIRYGTRDATFNTTPFAELQIIYTISIAPQAPTGLTTVTGIPIELDWNSPATTTTTTTPYISSTIKSGYGNPSFSGSDTLGYVAYANPWVYSTGYFFDVSTIPSGATITDVDIKYDVTSTTGASESCEVNPMTTTSSSSNSAIFTDSQDGTAFVDNSTWCNVGNGNDFTLDLGSSADTDLQNRSGGEWGIGMSLTNLTPSSNSQRVITGVELQVSYTSTNSGDGGSPITGYKVYRTLNEFALTELPDSSGSDSQITFTDNEFLLHGFETPTYKVHTFTSTGNFQITSGSGNVEVLVVAGGGGGGSGGGGAGGIVYDAVKPMTTGTTTVTVGSGGTGGSNTFNGGQGGDSVFDNITAEGGGFGAQDNTNGASGGSGGGGGATSINVGAGGTSTQTASGGDTGYGNNGGSSPSSSPYPSSGGGGAGSAGSGGSGSQNGNGGNGMINPISGSTIGEFSSGNYYIGAGGGGGRSGVTSGSGGLGGGGNGATNLSGGAGNTNTGSGGGGSYTTTYPSETSNTSLYMGTGVGGSGVVIVRYVDDGSITATGGTVTTISGTISLPDKSTNSISITATGTTTTGVISTGLQDPNLSFTDSNIPDNTDDFSIGSWVKLDTTPINTKLLGLNDVTFNVGTTSASVDGVATVNYKVHSFTSSGNFQITSGSGNVDYLMVAGGGGGGGSKTGNSGGGGGGAGGMLQNTASLSSNTYSITVGSGGTGGIGGYGTDNGGCMGNDGTDSTFNSLTAIGGGGGGAGSASGACAYQHGQDGGSGGGEGGYSKYLAPAPYYGVGTSGQGNDGGSEGSANGSNGGGGGAGSSGTDGTSATAGSGGDGLSSSITGTATFYAGGGGAGGYNVNAGTGGSSIGGDGGGYGTVAGNNAVANTGSGGGGSGISSGWGTTGQQGGSGSNGIVIVKYVDDGSITATGGTVTTTSAQSPITIINANGLTDNTSSPQHYSFVRDGNDWEIYQNGVSEATATDSTSLGANSATVSGYWEASSNTLCTISSSSATHTGTQSSPSECRSMGTVGIGDSVIFTHSLHDSAKTGLSEVGSSYGSGSQNDIEYGIYFSSSIAYMLIGGSVDYSYSSTFNANDNWKMTINSSGNIEVYKNNSLVHTFTTGITNEEFYLHTVSAPTNGYQPVITSDLTGSVTTSSQYTTNISGMIDEYFVNSDVLTATEIDDIYERGVAPTLLTTVTATEHDDSTVVGGNTYYFTLKSTNAVGDSDFLTPYVSGLAGTPADPPSSVSSGINNPNTAPLDITVSWSSPTNVGSGTLTGFEIYRDSVLIDTTGLVTSYTDTVPSGGGTFEYKLKSLSSHGTSGFSGTTSTTTPTVPPTPTATPTLAITNPNPSPLDIDVSWSAQTSGGSTITGYEIFRSATETGTYTSVGTVTDLDFTDTVPSAGTWYYTFASTNLVGSSGQSPSNSITTATVPSSPLNASSVIPSINSAPYDVTVSWELPTSTGGSALTGYNVYRQTGSGAFTLVDTTTALGYVDTVPSALNQDYTFKIHSLNNVGESTGFVTTTITTGDVPSAPVLSFTTGTTALSWTVPASDASITGYKIFRDSVLLTTVTTTTHSDFTTIVFGNSYDYKIVAVSSLGDSADSNTITTTPETEITGMIAQGITGTGAVIDWDEPAYYQGQITNYEVYYSEITASVTTPTTSAGTTTNTYSNFAPNLDYDTTYIFGVKVNSPLGNSGFSNYVTVTTSVDGSIVAFDPTTGGMEWFDIDSVNEQTVSVIQFQRETQDDMVNGTNIVFDTLQVAYPSWWDDMTCDIDYKFAQKTEQYVEGDDMTSLVNPSDANQQIIGFQFHDIDNEVIEVECAPQQSQQDDGVSAKYVMTQNSFGTLQADGTYSTGLPNIPLVTQITNFTSGEYGTDGDFGAVDIVGLFVILVSMVGFNRVSPIVGVLISASTIFALSFFGLIAIPTIIVGAIALVIFLAWGIHRKR